ncbi:uncharacterized protein ARMOST_19640 [Armillaria ostoyae]|uniref:Uncharacterized protein n=1 Tax=Armillaria ostoyae TaxID=47428 RepID=A0A284S537_ARMOS|nr:uncharacterized protein ARMOST_19640 [Armillaria ostoyae]
MAQAKRCNDFRLGRVNGLLILADTDLNTSALRIISREKNSKSSGYLPALLFQW